MEGNELYPKFTAIGEVIDDVPYQVDMGSDFKPYRRNIKYLNACHDVILSHLFLSYHLLKTKPHGVMCLDTAFGNRSRVVRNHCNPFMVGRNPVR